MLVLTRTRGEHILIDDDDVVAIMGVRVDDETEKLAGLLVSRRPAADSPAKEPQ